MKTIRLKGELMTGRVWLNGKELLPGPSQKVWHKSEQFAWGYSGSGPSQLALAICLELFGKEKALNIFQDFKFKYISVLPQSDFETTIEIDQAALDKV